MTSSTPALARRLPWIAYLVLASGIAATAAAWLSEAQRERRESLSEFRYETDQLVDAVRERMNQYVEVMRGAQSLVATYPSIAPATFEAYARSLDLPVHYPGFKSLQLVRAADNATDVRLAALDDSRQQFSITMPVSRGSAERHAVRAVLHTETALGGIIPDHARQTLRMQLVDAGRVDDVRSTIASKPGDQVVFDVGSSNSLGIHVRPSYRYTHNVGFTVGGRVWILDFERHDIDPMWRSGPLTILLFGSLAALLLFALVNGVYGQRDGALADVEIIGDKLQASEAYYRSVVDNIRDIVFQIDHKNRWQFVSASWQELTGEEPKNAIGRDALGWVNPADLAALRESLAQLSSGLAEAVQTRARFRLPQRGERWLQLHARSVPGKTNAPWVITGTLVDVTDSVLAQQTTEHRAQHDALTGLPNRALLVDRAAGAIDQAARADDEMALVFVDLDGFKQVNDRHGHHAGDAVLQIIAKRLQQAVRRSDLVARFGGDEFVVLIANGATATATERVLEQIRSVFVQPIRFEDERVEIKASFGVSTFPRDGTTLEALLRKADRAMYAEKTERQMALRVA